MRELLAIAPLLLGGLAYGADPAETPQIGSVQQVTFGEQLAQAKRMYFAGDHLGSLERFEALEIQLLTADAQDRVGSTLGAEALLYLGEVLQVLGRTEESSAAFEKLFGWDLEYPVSPYHHPIDVVRNAERVRAQVKAIRAPLSPPVLEKRRFPVTGYLPFGIPQMAEGRVGSGLAFGTAQVGLGVASIALFSQLNSVNVPSDGHPNGWGAGQVANQVNQQRYALQWPVSILFYGSWMWSYSDARRHWNVRERARVQAVLSPSPNGMMVSGRF
jgi:hypothetical protein